MLRKPHTVSRASGRRQRGYTLGELLTSVSVISILGAIAVPGMQDIMLNNRRVSITNEFSYALQLARSEAITRNQRVTVCASTSGVSCASSDYWAQGWIVFNDADRNRQVSSDEDIIAVFDGNESTSIRPIGITDSLSYRPNGRMMGDSTAVSSAEFVFCDRRGAEHSRVLIIAANGRPQVSATDSNGAAPTCSS